MASGCRHIRINTIGSFSRSRVCAGGFFGAPAFREALLGERDVAASQGVYNLTERDRYGLDDRSRIPLPAKDGK